MSFPLKKIMFAVTFNVSLFLMLMIGIQNSSSEKYKKINLIISETIELPISFIIGVSLICGSITGSFLSISLMNDK